MAKASSRRPGKGFGLLFALLFGSIGVLAGALPIGLMFGSSWQVRDWQPVQAEALESELRESDTYLVKGRYRYRVGEQWFESTRIGLDESPGSDNIGDWHQRWAMRLDLSKKQNLRLLAYVNPRQPQRALLDPNIRWPLFWFHLGFGLVFGGVGLGVGWATLRASRRLG